MLQKSLNEILWLILTKNLGPHQQAQKLQILLKLLISPKHSTKWAAEHNNYVNATDGGPRGPHKHKVT